jgi:hypothetical protein
MHRFGLRKATLNSSTNGRAEKRSPGVGMYGLFPVDDLLTMYPTNGARCTDQVRSQHGAEPLATSVRILAGDGMAQTRISALHKAIRAFFRECLSLYFIVPNEFLIAQNRFASKPRNTDSFPCLIKKLASVFN